VIRIITLIAFLIGTEAYALPTGIDYIFFTGLGTGSTFADQIARDVLGKSGTGLQTLSQEFQTDFAAQHVQGGVFAWDQESAAAQLAGTFKATDELVVVGHSFGGDSALQFTRSVIPGRSVDLLVTIDNACILCPGGTTKPMNVEHEIEITHTPNQGDFFLVKPFLHGLSDPDQRVNVTDAFAGNPKCLSDVGGLVTHTNISNSACVHDMILGATSSLYSSGTLPSVTAFLPNPADPAMPEPSTWLLLLSGMLVLALFKRYGCAGR
jgi:hypothetical protein